MSRELQQIAVHTQIRDAGKNSNAVSKLTSIPLPIMDLVTLAKIKLDIILNMEGRLWLAELSPMLCFQWDNNQVTVVCLTQDPASMH